MTNPPQSPIFFEDVAVRAAACHREGRLAEALALYGQLQAARPGDARLSSLVGTVLAQLGRAVEGLPFLSQAARLAPGDLEIANNLAAVLQDCGQTRAAADAWNQLGALFYQQRGYEDAILAFRRALALVPDHLGACANLGASLQALGRHQEAVTCLTAVLAGNPDEAEAHNNLGNARMGAGELTAAVASYRQAIALRPDYFEAYSNLGLALARLGPMTGTEDSGTSPQDVAGTLVNLGNARHSLDPTLDVQSCYEKALALRPDFPAAHWNLSLCLLLQGDFIQGWREYEWRWRWSGFGEEARFFPQPVWRGEPPLAVGGTLLVTAEQGYGDTVQFVRYLPLLVERGYTVVFEVQVPLFTLLWFSLGRYGVRVVPRTESPDRVHDDLPFARHISLMSPPERVSTRLETIPARVPYLFAEPSRQLLWAERLSSAALGRRRVGLVWQGRPAHSRDRERSMPVTVLEPLLAVPGVQFFSLQKEDPQAPAGIIPLGELLHDFAETAAAVAGLDLVITVDTALAHLTGALGRPAWVMLPFSPDWRWLLDRSDSPWYPTLTLFRQERAGDWATVVDGIVRRLSEGNACFTTLSSHTGPAA